ncbi:hypothetical protein HOG16_01790 [Candidatus Woesearchaeota archaeon]|nr:hypothetical protein [Candidatus Woesearchaeota archaeon]MBT4321936.1 hypothetical protein [Candidatus Woesearchaeota archaeon]
MYEKMKKIGKKALLVGAVAGSLYGGVAKADLPVSQDAREKIEYIAQEKAEKITLAKTSALEEVVGKFNWYIGDGMLSTGEQAELLYDFDEIEDKYGSIKGDEGELHNLLHENMHGLDMGETELEKTLRKEGLDVTVSPYFSSGELYLASSSCISLGIGLLLLYAERRLRHLEDMLIK